MSSNKQLSKYIPFFSIVLFMGLLNMYGTKSPALALIVAILEYGIVFFLLFSGKYSKAFFYYLAFTATILEFDVFVFGEGSSNRLHYNFAMLPIFKDYLRWVLSYIFAFHAYNEFKAGKYALPKSLQYLKKWLIILFVSGTISVIVGMLFNDNGMLNHLDAYPRIAFINIFQFLVRAGVLLTTVFLMGRKGWKEECSIHMQLILLCVALITVIAALIGFVGYYGANNETILIASLAVALTPLLVLFILKRDEAIVPVVSLIAGSAVIVASFIYGGTAIGSKWYLIIGLAAIGLIVIIARIRSVLVLAIGALAVLMVVPLVILPLVSLFDVNSYAAIKLDQALSTINIFGAQNTADWFFDMNVSPLQRFDELHNTFIEYTHKPWFAIFGKGLGGNIKHYTNLLSWSGAEDFTLDQIRMGLFYRMHESLGVIFLQHGIIGLVFFFKVIVMLLKRLYKTPWAMMGFIWMFFYWDYGVSLLIGAVIMVLALSEDENDNQVLAFERK